MDELDEATARAINAQPWDPLPGMLKRRCLRCRYVFALRLEEAEATPRPPIRERLRAVGRLSAGDPRTGERTLRRTAVHKGPPLLLF